jgi:hypothetical protein
MIFVLYQHTHKHLPLFFACNLWSNFIPKLENDSLDGLVLVETRLPNVHQVFNKRYSVFACVKELYHFTAFFDDFGMLICLKDDLKQIFLVHPLPELHSGA